MTFAYAMTTYGAILAILCGLGFVGVLALVVFSGSFRTRALGRFGDRAIVARLVDEPSGLYRTAKAVVFVIALACALLAAARPAFFKGERTVPAMSLDVVVVLDYSKSMYARDVAPSRIARAKAEVADLVQRLPGARFGAVAFAGEPMSFPLTSDGNAIVQFFRQIEPNDMPVGGTATARALQRAREILARDPRSKNHERVIVLVTDGEDLEGDPVAVAQLCKDEGTRIDVVQIGGARPEPVPEVDDRGNVGGQRRDLQGKPMTTSISPEGEAQLAKVAELTGGQRIASSSGKTGINDITSSLKKRMDFELSEKVQVLFDEYYAYPLFLALMLLVWEALLGETRALVFPAGASRGLRAFIRVADLFVPQVGQSLIFLLRPEAADGLPKPTMPAPRSATADPKTKKGKRRAPR